MIFLENKIQKKKMYKRNRGIKKIRKRQQKKSEKEKKRTQKMNKK